MNRRKIQIVVIGIIHKNDKYLLTKRIHSNKIYHNKWQFPGGGLEFGENFEQCLKREIFEETQLRLKNIIFIPKVFTTIKKVWQGVFICYLCEPINDVFEIILDEEASEYKWYKLDEIKKLDTLIHTINIVKEADKISAGKRT